MTSKGIAQRLIAKHGQQDAIWKVEDRLDSIAGLQAYFTSRADTAALQAYRMLWSAVLHHVQQS